MFRSTALHTGASVNTAACCCVNSVGSTMLGLRPGIPGSSGCTRPCTAQHASEARKKPASQKRAQDRHWRAAQKVKRKYVHSDYSAVAQMSSPGQWQAEQVLQSVQEWFERQCLPLVKVAITQYSDPYVELWGCFWCKRITSGRYV